MNKDELIRLMQEDAERATEKGNVGEARLTKFWLKRVQQLEEAPTVDTSDGDLVGGTEAARMLGHCRRWVYAHAEELPFAVEFPSTDGKRAFRFSRHGITEFLQRAA